MGTGGNSSRAKHTPNPGTTTALGIDTSQLASPRKRRSRCGGARLSRRNVLGRAVEHKSPQAANLHSWAVERPHLARSSSFLSPTNLAISQKDRWPIKSILKGPKGSRGKESCKKLNLKKPNREAKT